MTEERLGILPKIYTSSKRTTKLHSTRLQKSGFSPSASAREPEEREFVVDSGASMQMVSKKDLNSAELETMRTSRSPTTVMTANGEVQTSEEATVYVKQFDLFVTVVLLQETPAVLSGETRCMNPQEPKNKIKMRHRKKYKEIYRMNCLIVHRNSGRIWLMKVLQQSLGETQSNEVKTLPSHLLIFQCKPRAKVEGGSGMHSVYTHFPKDPNCDSCLKTKRTRASCRRRAGTVVPERKILVP